MAVKTLYNRLTSPHPHCKRQAVHLWKIVQSRCDNTPVSITNILTDWAKLMRKISTNNLPPLINSFSTLDFYLMVNSSVKLYYIS